MSIRSEQSRPNDRSNASKQPRRSGHNLVIALPEKRTTADQSINPLFEHLYETYYDEVYAFCARRVGRWAADDATSEAFIVAWRRIEDADLTKERAWLFGIARNVVRNAWRTSRRAKRTVEKVGSLRSPITDEADELASNWIDSTAIRSLKRLSERDQEVLMLSAWEGLSGDEIAEAIGIAPNAVHQRLHRAKRRLAAQMKKVTALEEGGM